MAGRRSKTEDAQVVVSRALADAIGKAGDPVSFLKMLSNQVQDPALKQQLDQAARDQLTAGKISIPESILFAYVYGIQFIWQSLYRANGFAGEKIRISVHGFNQDPKAPDPDYTPKWDKVPAAYHGILRTVAKEVLGADKIPAAIQQKEQTITNG